jgi:ribosome-binding factor A
MTKRRQERMSVEIQRFLAQILMEQIKDPRVDLSTVSVTRVDVSPDLGHARIHISVLGNEEKQQQTMKVLEKAKGFVRTELAKGIQLRHAPELEFRLDKSIEHGIRISSLLEEIKQDEETGKKP